MLKYDGVTLNAPGAGFSFFEGARRCSNMTGSLLFSPLSRVFFFREGEEMLKYDGVTFISPLEQQGFLF